MKNQQIKCPHCGGSKLDPADWIDDAMNHPLNTGCDDCGKTFSIMAVPQNIKWIIGEEIKP